MRSDYTLEILPDYLYIQVFGEYDVKDFKAYAAIFVEEGIKADRSRLLIDGSGISEKDVSVIDRFILGEEVARTFGYKFKVAIVWPKVYAHKIMEMTAQNRGARFGIFGDPGEAREWLVKNITEDA